MDQSKNSVLLVVLLMVFATFPVVGQTRYQFTGLTHPLEAAPTPTTFYLDHYLNGLAGSNTASGPGYGRHPGIDYPANEGTEVLSMFAGKVIHVTRGCPNTSQASCGGGWGNHVLVEHYDIPGYPDDRRLLAVYAHLRGNIPVCDVPSESPHCPTAQVGKGDLIGYVSTSGNSGGVHLHFQVDVDGDATPYFPGNGSLPPWAVALRSLGGDYGTLFNHVNIPDEWDLLNANDDVQGQLWYVSQNTKAEVGYPQAETGFFNGASTFSTDPAGLVEDHAGHHPSNDLQIGRWAIGEGPETMIPGEIEGWDYGLESASERIADLFNRFGGTSELGNAVDNGGGSRLHRYSFEYAGNGADVEVYLQDVDHPEQGQKTIVLVPEAEEAFLIQGCLGYLWWQYQDILGAPTGNEFSNTVLFPGGLGSVYDVMQTFQFGNMFWDEETGRVRLVCDLGTCEEHEIDACNSNQVIAVREIDHSPVDKVGSSCDDLRPSAETNATGQITSPNGSHTGDVNIFSTVTDPDGLARVRVFLAFGGTPLSLCGSPAPACSGNSGVFSRIAINPDNYGASAGNVAIRLFVQDSQGNEMEVDNHSFSWQPAQVPRFFGRVTDSSGQPVEGVRMDGLPSVLWTDENGEYSVAVESGWSGTVDPRKAGYAFVPPNRPFNNVTGDTRADFVGTLDTEVISGMVTFSGDGLEGVVMNGLPGNPMTDANGEYSVTLPFHWTGTVSPSRDGFALSPPNRSYDQIGMSRFEEDYTAVQETLNIGGRVTYSGNGLAGVWLGGLPGGVTTDSNGDYFGIVPFGWTGTVTPFKHGFDFTPGTENYSDLISNRPSDDYTAAIQPGQAGQVWVVSTSGELQSASQSARSGDVILVKPGTYSQLSLRSPRDNVILVSEGGPEQTILEPISSIRFDADNAVVDGFTFRNDSTSSEPVQLVGVDNMQIRNSIFYGNGSEYGLRITSGNNLLIENSVFASGNGILLRSNNTTGSLTIRNNRFSGLTTGALVGFNPDLDVVLENNLFEEIGRDGLEIDPDLRSIRIENSVFANNNDGIALDENPGAVIKNCVFYNNERGADIGGSAQVTFENNIFVGNVRGVEIGSNVTATVHHAMHWGNNSVWFSSGKWNRDESTIWEQDPEFVAQGIGDFHLDPASPARGMGSGGVDLGAYGGPRGDDWINPPGMPTPPSLESVDVTGATETQPGGNLALRSEGQYAGGYYADLTSAVSWNSSNPAVLESQGLGVFLAHSPGSATVTVSLDGMTSTHSVTVVSASLSVGLSDSSDPVAPGDSLVLTLVAANAGPGSASNVIVTADLPSQFSFASAVPEPDAGTTGRWSLGDLASGGSASILITAEVSETASVGVVTTQAAVTAELTPSVQGMESTTILGFPDLEITKQADATSVDPGAGISYTINYQNTGSGPATEVVLTEIYSPLVSFASANPIPNSGNNVWHLGTLAPGESGSITVDVAVDAQAVGSIINRVTVLSAEDDPTLENNSAKVTTEVNPRSDLSIVLASPPTAVLETDIVSYFWSVTNLGPATASTVQVSDLLPSGLTLVAATASQGGSCSGTGPVVCSLGSLAPGANVIIEIEVRADVVGVHLLDASVNATEPDDDLANNHAVDSITVTPSTDLLLAMSDSPDPISPGGVLTYTLTITNFGPSNSTGGEVTVALSPSLSFTSSANGCSAAGPTVICPFGSLVEDGTVDLSFVTSVDSSMTGVITTSATVSGNESDPEVVSNTSTTTTQVEVPCFLLTLDRSGSGDIPIATSSAEGCAVGRYQAGEIIELTANPASGWDVGSWSGSADDSSTSTMNSVAMPENDHILSVGYVETAQPCFLLAVDRTGMGAPPTILPLKSPGCPLDEFHPGSLVDLTAAPDPGSTLGGWSGTDDDSSTRWVNRVTMPSTSHLIVTDYVPCVAERLLPPGYAENLPGQVVLFVEPDSSVFVYAVEETPPEGWSVTGVNEGGIFDAGSGTVKWGPYFGNSARELSYSVTPPTGTIGSWSFEGIVSTDGKDVALCGDILLDPASLHPGDMSDDWAIQINEITAYGAAWRTETDWPRPPSDVPIGYVTNAGFLWRVGEDYHFDPTQNPPWVAGTVPESTLMSPGGHGLGAIAGVATSSFDLSEYTPGQGVGVTLELRPDDSNQVYAVEDGAPLGWAVTDISDGGVFVPSSGLVKWGPFFDNLDRDLTYIAIPPAEATGLQEFSGQASFDGVNVPIEGERTMSQTCAFVIDPASQVMGPDGGSGSVSVTASEGCFWEAQATVEWMTIDTGSSGSGDGNVSFTVSASSSGIPRMGTLIIAGETFVVDQAGVPCSFGIDPTSASLPPSGGSGSVAVTSPEGCPWTAVSNDGWATVDTGSSGTGSGTVSFSVSSNASSVSRAGTLTVAGQVFTLSQDGVMCTYAIDPTSMSLPSDGGSGSVTVTSPEGCSWTAVSNDGWAVVDSGMSGSGSGTVSYSVSENTNAGVRIGILTVASQTFTLTQDGVECFGLILSHSGAGSNPVSTPTSSVGCPQFEYRAGELVDLTAFPDPGWAVQSWVGTSDDSSTSVSNSMIMPTSSHSVEVDYLELDPVVLVVDDDDNRPDVRNYYLEAISAVDPGLVFDVWDTNNTDNEPDAATLSNYKAVLWFTGAEFGGFAGPSADSEAEIGVYLDGGGCFVISSQSYMWDRGGEGDDSPTAFMLNYLGVGSASSDVQQSTVTGTGSVFGDFGVHTLALPFSNFSDIISPDGSAELACHGNLGDAAINKNSGVFRTIFFGFPLEGLPTVEERAEAIRRVLAFCEQSLFSDGFESGDVSAWNGAVGD